MAVEERNGTGQAPEVGTSSPRHPGRTVALFVILAGFWLLLSGRLGIQFLIFMALSIGTVLWMNPERPFRRPESSRYRGLAGRLRATMGLANYLVWLVWNVMKANIEVAIMILHPGLPIRPQLLKFRTTLKDDVARVLVANSITLTPGTVTIDLEGDEYLVHAIHPRSIGAIEGGALQSKVAAIFGENPDPPPQIEWGSSLQEMTE